MLDFHGHRVSEALDGKTVWTGGSRRNYEDRAKNAH